MVLQITIYYLLYEKMLSQSMLQKFTSKIQKLVNNRPSQRSQSPVSQVQQMQSQEQERQQTPIKKITNLANNRRLRNSSVEQSNQIQNGNESVSQDNQQDNSPKNKVVISLDDKSEDYKSEKIDTKQLSRLIALEKQKAQSKINSSANQSGTIRKSAGPSKSVSTITASVIKPQAVQTTTAPKPGIIIQMPKVAVMNNLVKLSTKIGIRDLLKQIIYQASRITMASIRLLLYFCIERILYNMYELNGYDKMTQKSKDIPFMEKQIQMGLIQLLIYLKNPQRTMISRILKGVFNRLGMLHIYSQKWLTQCVKTHKKSLQNAGINTQQIQSLPSHNNITSNIFIGVPTTDKKINYNYPSLQLQDESTCNQRVQDPQVFHAQQKLFFFKNLLNTHKQKIKSIEVDENECNPQKKYQVHQFKIETWKSKIPENTRVYANQNNPKQFEIMGKIKNKPKQNVEPRQQIVSKKRARTEVYDIPEEPQESKMQNNKNEQKQIPKQKIMKIVQEYIFGNINVIADKIAQKWKIKPQQIRDIIKQSSQAKSQPTKMKPQAAQQPVPQSSSRSKPKVQSDLDIIKQIDDRSNQLERQGVSHKQLVRQVFKLLESKNLTHEEKEQVMERWIAMKKQKKMNGR